MPSQTLIPLEKQDLLHIAVGIQDAGKDGGDMQTLGNF